MSENSEEDVEEEYSEGDFSRDSFEEDSYGEEASKYSFPEEIESGVDIEYEFVPQVTVEGPPKKKGIVTEQDLKDIAHELGLIKLCWTDKPEVDFENRLHYPLSYLSNNRKEKLLLLYAENFRQQFNCRYSYRRPLLIACNNECGIQKVVCTTIRPTNIKFPEFQTWQGCASFVAEHLNYEYLTNPTALPDHIRSPQTVLKRQAGHCFEFATLLVSFLLASGYDAYVVSGYATREVCQKDQTRTDCPFLVEEEEVEEERVIEKDTKYFLKEPVKLKSQFLQDMENREIVKQKEAQKIQEQAELEAIKDFEKPSPDELNGWRLHSWVLVLPSKDVLMPFFIETTTGLPKSTNDPEYIGIESIWNNLNYWVLVQFENKTTSCKEISFDLNNPVYWERLLIGEPMHFRQLPMDVYDPDSEEYKRACILAEKHLDMPTSWVDILHLPHSTYEKRYPQAKKMLHYRKASSEQYAPYSNPDGLLERVTLFNDYECAQPREIREKYKNRSDLLYFCQRITADNSVREKFQRGREDALKEHFYYSMDTGIEGKFTLLFYHEARLDGLSKLVMDPLFLKMYFENRADFLHFVHVDFAERTNQNQPFRIITKITEKFLRNPEKPADRDVAMVEFFYAERKLHLKFHYEYEHLTQGHREFKKPTFVESGGGLTFDPFLTKGYLTGPHVPPPKPLYLFQLEMEFFKQEALEENKIRERENELMYLLQLRARELAVPKLKITEFDVERNVDAKQAFKDKEQESKELEDREMNMKCDFLAPYYAKYGFSPKTVLPQKDAQAMMEECLQDWKNLLVARANDMQQQFEQMCQDFYDKNNWYEQNQSKITKEQEEEYFDYCKTNSYNLHILEVRLHRHKELAPKRYSDMYVYLKTDPRLEQAFRQPRRRRNA